MSEISNGNGKRQINPRSLENLRLGAETRKRDKVRRNCTLLPQTIQWLENTGNASEAIDVLVASARNGSLKFSSDNAHNVMPDLEVKADIKPIRQWAVICRDHQRKESFKGAYFSESEANDRIAKLKRDAHASASMGDHPYLPPNTYEIKKCLVAPVSQQSINAHDSILELEDRLARRDRDCAELQRENQRLLADAAKADAAIGSLRSQLEDQATKSGEWWEKAKLAQEEIERLRQLEKDSTEQIIELNRDGFKAATALKEALKAKAVGQIKAQIRFALQLIDDI